MSARPSRRDDRSLTPAGLIDSLLGSDERTRRAKSLMVTASACTALLTLAIMLPLTIVFGATGVVGGGLLTTVSAVLATKSFSHRQRNEGAS